MDRLILSDRLATATSPEGVTARMPLRDFLDRVRPPLPGTGPIVLPDGVRMIHSSGRMLVLFYEMRPAVRPLSWIRSDSREKYGPGAIYSPRTVSLPYIGLFAVFAQTTGGYQMTKRNEVYFMTRSALSLTDEDPLDDTRLLCFPSLLNVSRYGPYGAHAVPGKAMSWFCTMHWSGRHDIARDPRVGRRIVRSLSGLSEYLLTSSYNFSSELNPSAIASGEKGSWFTAYVDMQVDRRLGSIEAWERASARDSAFVLSPDFPWLRPGLSPRQVAQRICTEFDPQPAFETATDCARLVFSPRQGAGSYPHPMF